jgi:hypothetical protein
VDSSTLIWKNQIQSSKYIKGVKTCDGEQNCNVPINRSCPDIDGSTNLNTGICSFGGAGRTTSIQTGSSKQFLSIYSGAAGSASNVYSSDIIMLQKAGKESCSIPGTNPAPQNSYVVLPGGDPLTSNAELQVPSSKYLCNNTNGPSPNSTDVIGNSTITGNPNNLPINNQSNPYLPQFDTYYRFKNPSCNQPIEDQNQKHFVKECHTRFPDANNGVNALYNPCNNTTYLNPITKQFETNPNSIRNGIVIPPTCNGCILQS